MRNHKRQAMTKNKKNPPQLSLFNPQFSAEADTTVYTLFIVAPERANLTFQDANSFDKAAAFIRENKSTGTIIHEATGIKAKFNNGVFYSLKYFPIINVFSPLWLTPPDAGVFTSSEEKPPA